MTEKLVRDTMCKIVAQGVFVWVYLVVRSLLDGFAEGDRLVHMQRRLHSLPTDLEK